MKSLSTISENNQGACEANMPVSALRASSWFSEVDGEALLHQLDVPT